jgi:ABC-2 type transport system ATP-binding protein
VPRAGRAVQGLIRDLDRSGIDLESIEVRRPTLDDVFLTLTGRSLRDAESEADADAERPGQAPEGTPDSDEPAAQTPEGALQ